MKKTFLEEHQNQFEQKVMVISGMGGCGKTQLVAQFMKEYWIRYGDTMPEKIDSDL
jgi:hypothetical protein